MVLSGTIPRPRFARSPSLPKGASGFAACALLRNHKVELPRPALQFFSTLRIEERFFRREVNSGPRSPLLRGPLCVWKGNRFLSSYSIFTKKVMVMLLIKSANILPTMGTRIYALTEGTNRSVRACILAIALGVAPMPKPQVPAARTAAS